MKDKDFQAYCNYTVCSLHISEDEVRCFFYFPTDVPMCTQSVVVVAFFAKNSVHRNMRFSFELLLVIRYSDLHSHIRNYLFAYIYWSCIHHIISGQIIALKHLQYRSEKETKIFFGFGHRILRIISNERGPFRVLSKKSCSYYNRLRLASNCTEIVTLVYGIAKIIRYVWRSVFEKQLIVHTAFY